LESPLYLTHFVTNKCNLECRHCFYHNFLNKEIKTPGFGEIEKMIKSLKRPLERVVITGGEPFLYPNLASLCLAYKKINKAKQIFLDTNGYTTGLIAETVNNIAAEIDSPLHIQLSLDGPPSVHNFIRGKENAFKKLSETVKVLKDLRKVYPNLKIHALIVISSLNHSRIEETFETAEKLGVDYGFELVRIAGISSRGKAIKTDYKPKDAACTLPEDGELSSLILKIKKFSKERNQKSENFLFSLYIYEEALKALRENGKHKRCLAAGTSAIVYPDMEVSICEMKNSLGNLSDYDFNLPRLLEEKAKTESFCCRCTHGCTLMLEVQYNILKNFKIFALSRAADFKKK
ncbi:MAG: radical SAM protein, partial [Candidatus Omnitrophica bacterium]|nr:radical SAM protein [Candidatus Omnitrophota bacterium]MBD3268628.1 radical SAM protein [Candidatus Omnitrophota bacterium]